MCEFNIPMKIPTQAIETTGIDDAANRLLLDEVLRVKTDTCV